MGQDIKFTFNTDMKVTDAAATELAEMMKTTSDNEDLLRGLLEHYKMEEPSAEFLQKIIDSLKECNGISWEDRGYDYLIACVVNDMANYTNFNKFFEYIEIANDFDGQYRGGDVKRYYYVGISRQELVKRTIRELEAGVEILRGLGADAELVIK